MPDLQVRTSTVSSAPQLPFIVNHLLQSVSISTNVFQSIECICDGYEIKYFIAKIQYKKNSAYSGIFILDCFALYALLTPYAYNDNFTDLPL